MSDLLNNSEIVATLQTLAKTLKTPEYLVNLNSQLTKITIEAALNGEMKELLVITNILQMAIIQGIVEMVTQKTLINFSQ